MYFCVYYYYYIYIFISTLKNSKTFNTGRYIELVLQKPSSDVKYWPYLTKEKKKYHWLKVDFKKWKDEDDSEDESSLLPGGPADDGGLDDVCEIYFILNNKS